MYEIFNKITNTFSFKVKITILIFIDIITFTISHIISNYLREEIYWYNVEYYYFILLFSFILTIATLFYFDVYKNFLRYTNLKLFFRIFYACCINSIIFLIFLSYFNFYNFPRSISLIQPFVFFFLLTFSRIVIQNIYQRTAFTSTKSNIIIYGAGKAGIASVDILDNYNVVALVDDDLQKQGRKYGKIPIISQDDLDNYIFKYKIEKLYTALPSINILQQRDILRKLKKYNLQILNLPNINQITPDTISYIDFENIITSDLLGRKIYDHNTINKSFFEQKNILVTGGGGSIGSEICLQLINTNFLNLNILDHSELNIYNIKKQIDEYCEATQIECKINYYVCSIQDVKVLENIFKYQKIDIVFHTAAYKHVNLVENNIHSAVSNNIISTYNLCNIAKKYKSANFILISSDKAVRPTNIMGATKRIAEKIVYFFSNKSETIFSIVRFGNVINSSGSVIPIFRSQIKNNKKLTVTSKKVERYFMTISEAVGLVIESCILSRGGETFFLNMGKSIKIFDLAKKMIKISDPNTNISDKYTESRIKIIGLKKGEKLYEELSINNSTITNSPNKNIYIDDSNKSLKYIDPSILIRQFEMSLLNYNNSEIIKLLEENVEDFKFNLV